MTSKAQKGVIHGYMILPIADVNGYHGVDREPFEPILPEDMCVASCKEMHSRPEFCSEIWPFLPPGWRQDAYKLYEANLAPNLPGDLYLLSNKDAAENVRRLIQPSCDVWQVVFVEVLEDIEVSSYGGACGENLWGIDVAYPGGNLYSAIRNGLFVNPETQLMREFQRKLNRLGLFDSFDVTRNYLRRFKELVLSEGQSDFRYFVIAGFQNISKESSEDESWED